MDVEIELTPAPAFPAVDGAHRLAWQIVLDVVFAEAAHAGVGTLRLTLPAEALRGEAELRARLTRSSGDRAGIAWLGAEGSAPAEPAVAFTLGYGALAPAALRAAGPGGPAGWRRGETLAVYTAVARGLGVPMSLLNRLRAPRLADRAMFAMRGSFASPRRVPAFYHLTRWAP